MDKPLFNLIDHYCDELGSSRLLKKLRFAFENKQYYEAHQIFKTLFFRYSSSQDRLNVLQPLLYQGAILLLKLGEHQSGQDVANLFVDACAKILLIENKCSTDHTKEIEISENITNIAKELPTDTELGLQKFISDSFKALSPRHMNNDILHEKLAIFFWKDKRDYVNSRYHFMHSASIKDESNTKPLCTSMLIEYHLSLGYPSESDLFIAQFILQLLCLRQPTNSKKTNHPMMTVTKTATNFKGYAERILCAYTRDHPNIRLDTAPYPQPLLNFLFFLISILDTKDARTFKILRDIYNVSLNRDPNYSEYLTRIGSIYFDLIDKTQSRNGGLFGNLLQSLMDDTDNGSEIADPSDNSEADLNSRGGKNSICSQLRDEELD